MSRIKGFVVGAASRTKAQSSNPWKRGVICPGGKFVSLREAAKALGITAAVIAWRCEQGEIQRASGEKPKYTDFREWYRIDDPVRPLKRAVISPDGTFVSVAECARHYSVTSATIIRRIREFNGWEYK